MDKEDYFEDVAEKNEVEDLRKGIIAHCSLSKSNFKRVYGVLLWCRFHQFNLITDFQSTSTLWRRFILFIKQMLKIKSCSVLYVCKFYVRDL